MSKAHKMTATGVALALLLSVLALLGGGTPSETPSSQPSQTEGGETALGGLKNDLVHYFFQGIVSGSQLEKWETLTMNAGTNQIAIRNTSGRTRYITDVNFTTSGVASTSYVFYGATSSASTFSADYTQPPIAAQHFAIHGVTIATSTNIRTHAATTTANGLWPYPWHDGEYYVFQMQEKFGCGRAANASSGVKCESATSTNTGLGNIKLRLKWIQEDNG